MPEITLLTGSRDWIDLDFVERERTPEPLMALNTSKHCSELASDFRCVAMEIEMLPIESSES